MQFISLFKRGIFVASTGAAFGLAGISSAAAQQCPDWSLGGVPVTTDAETAWVPQQYPMYAGGALDLRQCPTVDGVGYITPAPNFSITYDERGMGRDLELRVESSCDTTLLVNNASGEWSFSDDASGMNPGLRLTGAPSGRYDVWIGTYSQQACQATLIAETFNAAPPVQTTCPDWSLGGAQVNMATGQNDARPVNAGGPVSLFDNTCQIPGHGYVTQAPNFSLYLDTQSQPTTLELSVQGECDQTLLVNNPSAQWEFNDDDQDLHPRLTIADAPAGRYDIWVGTFGSQSCASQLSISAYGPQGQAPAAGK